MKALETLQVHAEAKAGELRRIATMVRNDAANIAARHQPIFEGYAAMLDGVAEELVWLGHLRDKSKFRQALVVVERVLLVGIAAGGLGVAVLRDDTVSCIVKAQAEVPELVRQIDRGKILFAAGHEEPTSAIPNDVDVGRLSDLARGVPFRRITETAPRRPRRLFSRAPSIGKTTLVSPLGESDRSAPDDDRNQF